MSGEVVLDPATAATTSSGPTPCCSRRTHRRDRSVARTNGLPHRAASRPPHAARAVGRPRGPARPQRGPRSRRFGEHDPDAARRPRRDRARASRRPRPPPPPCRSTRPPARPPPPAGRAVPATCGRPGRRRPPPLPAEASGDSPSPAGTDSRCHHRRPRPPHPSTRRRSRGGPTAETAPRPPAVLGARAACRPRQSASHVDHRGSVRACR